MSKNPNGGRMWVSRPLDTPNGVLVWFVGKPEAAPHGKAWYAERSKKGKAMEAMHVEVIQYLFGIAPPPGEAWFFDQCDYWNAYCSKCDEPTPNYYEPCSCGHKQRGFDNCLYHALVNDRMTLKEADNDKVQP